VKKPMPNNDILIIQINGMNPRASSELKMRRASLAF